MFIWVEDLKKNTQVVSGQGSIRGVKYRKKCWTGKQLLLKAGFR